MEKNPLSRKSVRQCRLCPLLGQDHVPSEGNPQADVMFIGQSPGKVEVELGLPFVGPAGDIFNFMLDEAEIRREDVYIANVLKCKPPDNRKARPDERNNCWRTWLHFEIQAVAPRLVVLLGADAHAQVLPPELKFKHLLVTSGKTYKFLTSYHPAYCIYKNDVSFILETGQWIRVFLDSVQDA